MKMKARRRPSKAELAKIDALLRSSVGQRALARVEHMYPSKLTPSPNGRECLANGKWPGYVCQCAGCDFYETCFPDWEGHKSV